MTASVIARQPDVRRTARSDGANGARVTYVVSRWGAPTETFVRREAAAVADAGARVSAVSMKRPGSERVRGIPVTHLGSVAVIRDALRTLFRRPVPAWTVLVTVLRHASPRTIMARLAAAMIGLAWVQRPEVADAPLLHVHFGWVAAAAAWATTRVTGGRYSVVLHAFEIHSRHTTDRFAGRPLRDADAVFTISERDLVVVRDRWGVEAEVLRMGVSADWLVDPVPTTEREEHLVVSVGSLVPKKGHGVLIEAIAQTRAPWRLVIVGEGPERAALQRVAERAGAGARVEFFGHCDEVTVRRLVRGAAVTALACVVAPDGDQDGIPVALMEAMASSTPVVATRVGAIDELVDGCGMLVEPGDVSGLACAIDALDDVGTRARLGDLGRARVVREFVSSNGGSRVAALAADQERAEP